MTAGHANAGYRRLFDGDGLTFGTGFPLTDNRESRPPGDRELELAAHAESVGFDALWARDVPLYWPRFGDVHESKALVQPIRSALGALLRTPARRSTCGRG